MFFSRLSYSFGNEDPHTENQALQIKPDDEVLCITASGDRPLHLLLNNCRSVTSVDLNPHQNHLLWLKMAAMRTLSFEEYLAFLGAIPGQERIPLLATLSNALPSSTVDYWKSQAKFIEQGILYQGALERFMRRVLAVLGGIRKRKIDPLFTFQDLEAQRAFVKAEWHTPSIRFLLRLALHPLITRLFFKDPGLYKHVDQAIRPHQYIYERFTQGLMRGLAKENLFVSLFFRGFVAPEAFPPYLTQSGFDKIKPQLGKVSVQTKDLIEYLEQAPKESFDAFSISDVASYLTQEQFERLVRAIHRTAKPRARFCMREFMSNHQLPADMKHRFVRDSRLEQKLGEEDCCLIYRFMVGEII